MKNWKTPKVKHLAKAFTSIKNENIMLSFLRDLCTIEEIIEMANRWEAVQMIEKGKPYREIAAQTGMSTTTVTRIAHWLEYGEGGYKEVLKNMKK